MDKKKKKRCFQLKAHACVFCIIWPGPLQKNNASKSCTDLTFLQIHSHCQNILNFIISGISGIQYFPCVLGFNLSQKWSRFPIYSYYIQRLVGGQERTASRPSFAHSLSEHAPPPHLTLQGIREAIAELIQKLESSLYSDAPASPQPGHHRRT